MTLLHAILLTVALLTQSVPYSLALYLARTAVKHSNYIEGKVSLRGITVLEAPFVYPESGPYRGFSVDVINEISKQANFNYSLKQSPDGLIGSLSLMNGVFGELSRDQAEFAIGDISRNWFNDEATAHNVGILFTRPVLTSSMVALLSKNLKNQLGNNKKSKCLEKLNELQKNKTSQVRVFRCSEKVTIEDIFEAQQVNKLVIKGSAVHEFLSRQGKLSDLILVEKSSLFGYGLDKLQNHNYVLVDEQKFAEHFADQNCHFDLVYPNGFYNDELANVLIGQQRRVSPKFSNEIVIALSTNLIQKHKAQFGRNYLADFNRIITKLEESGKLRELRDKHWRNNCLHSTLPNSGKGIFSSISLVNLVIFLIMCFSLS